MTKTTKNIEERFRSLVETINDWVWEINKIGEFTYSSPQVEKILGYLPEEIVGQQFSFFLMHDNMKTIMDRIDKHISLTQPIDNLEADFNHKHGDKIVLETSAVPILHEDKFEGYRGVSRDITAKKRAEAELFLSEERYRNIWASSPLGMLLFELLPDDKTLIFTGANLAADNILRIETDLYIGKGIEDLFPKISEEAHDAFLKVAANGKPWRNQIITYKDERIKGVFEVNAFQTEPNHLVVTLSDVSERILAENKLVESEERYRKLITKMSEGIWLTDINNITIYVNPAIEKMLGYSQDEMIGMNVINFISQDSISTFIRVNKERHEKSAGAYELVFVHKNGDEVITRVAASSLLDSENRIIGSFGVISDITAEKRTEEARRDLEQRRAEFISLASHELRTPLSIIKGYIDLLGKRLFTLSEEERSKSFQIIQKNIERLNRLVSGVSELTKIERGIFTLNFEIISIKEYLEEAIRPHQDILGPQFIYTCDETFPIFVKIDQDRITQVLNNLIENAINHTDEKKREIKFKCYKYKDSVEISINDNGAGIAPDQLETIFEPFVTFPSKYSKKITGTGIGLYLSRIIITEHQGELKVSSEGLDQGATFLIRLPVVETS
ncbi:PAS domain-containing sensor histidine kinase [Candidatus Hodarchaeum mangrovi]